jgi:hypothetical protein
MPPNLRAVCVHGNTAKERWAQQRLRGLPLGCYGLAWRGEYACAARVCLDETCARRCNLHSKCSKCSELEGSVSKLPMSMLLCLCVCVCVRAGSPLGGPLVCVQVVEVSGSRLCPVCLRACFKSFSRPFLLSGPGLSPARSLTEASHLHRRLQFTHFALPPE